MSVAECLGQLPVELFDRRIEVLPELLHSVQDEVALPQFVDEALFVAALPREHGQFVVRDHQVALPRGVGRVGLGQTLPDAERLAEEPLGLGQNETATCNPSFGSHRTDDTTHSRWLLPPRPTPQTPIAQTSQTHVSKP